MLFQGLADETTGRLRTVTTATPLVAPAGSIAFRGLCVDEETGGVYITTAAVNAADVFIGGLRVSPVGVLYTTLSAGTQVAPGGLAVNADGVLSTVAGAPDLVLAGVGMSQAGGVCIVDVTPVPPVTYATWSPTNKHADITLSNGNLTASSGGIAFRSGRATGPFAYAAVGKFYYEHTINEADAAGSIFSGIATPAMVFTGALGLDANLSYGWQMTRAAGARKSGNFSQTAYGAISTMGDVIGVALDLTAGTLTFYKNGVSQGVAFSGLAGGYMPAYSLANEAGVVRSMTARFDPASWTQTPPAGHGAWIIPDAPTDVTTTWNPADKGASVVLSDGDLRVTANASDWDLVRATVSAASGKRYFEVVATSSLSGRLMFGVAKSTATLTNFVGADANGWSLNPNQSATFNNLVSTGITLPFSPNEGDIYGVFLDLDAGTVRFSMKGVAMPVAYSGLSGTFFPACSAFAAGGGNGLARFARSSWSYPPGAEWKQWGEA